MAQLVASISGVVLGGVVEVEGSNLARGKILTASIGTVDLLYPSLYIYSNLNRGKIFTPTIGSFDSLYISLYILCIYTHAKKRRPP